MKKNKLYIVMVVVLVVGFVIGVFIKPSDLYRPRDTEYSYQTGGNISRYLRSFNKTKLLYPEDMSSKVSGAQASVGSVESTLQYAALLSKEFDWFKKIENEHIFIYVTDIGNARFTLGIDKGAFSIKKGFDTSKEPTLVIPITTAGLQNLAKLLEDGKLNYSDKYQIYNAIAAPALQALYRTNVLYSPGDKSIFKFDDLVHVVIPPTQDVYYRGVPLNIELTAVNVDGQWMVFPGLQGDPDFKVSLSLEQAEQLYVSGIYEIRGVNTPSEALEISKRFRGLMEKTIVYTRADHE